MQSFNAPASLAASTKSEIRIAPNENSFEGSDVLGKIQILQAVGEGSCGRVFKAWHRELQIHVAVKVLHEHLADSPEKIARFKSEAKFASTVTHPSIVKIFDYGFLPGGAPFIVMEYIPDGTLADLIRLPESRDDLQLFYSVFIQVCNALAFAHSKGVLHRDIKPDNILVLRKPSGEALPKIADWGIAKLVYFNELGPSQTATGDIMGSPAYMSPEQCLGQQTEVASDLYSLGCIMHEWLTGRPAFSGRNAFDCMRMHLEDTPELVREVRTGVPVALERLIYKCLQKEQSERPASATAVGDALGALSQGQHAVAMTLLSRSTPDLTKAKTQFQSTILSFVLTLSVLAMFAVAGLTITRNIPSDISSSLRFSGPEVPIAQHRQELSTVEDAPAVAVDPHTASHKLALQEMVNDLDSAAFYYGAAGDKTNADRALSCAAQAVNLFKNANFERSNKPQLHLVCFSEGKEFQRFDPRGSATVRVSDTSSPVVLALSSRQEVHWSITVDPGVKLQKIILSGHQKNKIVGLPHDVPVIKSSEEALNFGWITDAMRCDNDIQRLQQVAQCELTTIQGSYQAGEKTWFVGPESSDWKAQLVIRQMADSYAGAMKGVSAQFDPSLSAGCVRFSMFELSSKGEMNSQFGSLVLPAQAERIFDADVRTLIADKFAKLPVPVTYSYPLVELPSSNQFFLATDSSVEEVEPGTGRLAHGPLPINMQADRTNICDDGMKDGLFLMNSKGLFHASTLNMEWVKLASPPLPSEGENEVTGGLLYSGRDQVVYTLVSRAPIPFSADGYTGIRTYSREGRLLGEVPLQRRIGSEYAGVFTAIQLKSFGKYMVAIFSTADNMFPRNLDRQRYYLIDPANGRILLTGTVRSANGR